MNIVDDFEAYQHEGPHVESSFGHGYGQGDADVSGGNLDGGRDTLAGDSSPPLLTVDTTVKQTAR